jgi:site-specific recombinase XerD
MKKRVGRPKGTTKERIDVYAEQFKLLLKYIESDDKRNEQTKSNAIKSFFLLYYFGFRVGELTKLTVKDLKHMVNKRVISLANNTKTKSSREAYISFEHVGILEKLFIMELEEDSAFSIIRPWGKVMSQYAPSRLTTLLNSIMHSALGEQYSTHSFRAGYVTHLFEAGHDLEMRRALIGHKNLATTAKYTTVSEKLKREAVSTLPTVEY